MCAGDGLRVFPLVNVSGASTPCVVTTQVTVRDTVPYGIHGTAGIQVPLCLRLTLHSRLLLLLLQDTSVSDRAGVRFANVMEASWGVVFGQPWRDTAPSAGLLYPCRWSGEGCPSVPHGPGPTTVPIASSTRTPSPTLLPSFDPGNGPGVWFPQRPTANASAGAVVVVSAREGDRLQWLMGQPYPFVLVRGAAVHAGAYAQFIVDHWDHLPPVMVFAQGEGEVPAAPVSPLP